MNDRAALIIAGVALLVLAGLAPFHAKLLGTFPDAGPSFQFFSALRTSSYASLGVVRPVLPPERADTAVFIAPELEAASAVVYDIEHERILFAKNETDARPLASLTKLATALAAQSIAAGAPAASRVVEMTEDAVSQEGEDGFFTGERFAIDDLVDAMLVRSSNDAAAAIAEWGSERLAAEAGEAPEAVARARFVNEMNRIVSEQGLSDTYFLNPTGLDEGVERAGAYGTALDMARLFAWILAHSSQTVLATEFSSVDIASQDGVRHLLKSSARDVFALPGLIGVKTGFTDLAQGNVVLGWSAGLGRHFVLVVLGSSADGRFSDALALYAATMDFVQAPR